MTNENMVHVTVFRQAMAAGEDMPELSKATNLSQTTVRIHLNAICAEHKLFDTVESKRLQ